MHWSRSAECVGGRRHGLGEKPGKSAKNGDQSSRQAVRQATPELQGFWPRSSPEKKDPTGPVDRAQGGHVRSKRSLCNRQLLRHGGGADDEVGHSPSRGNQGEGGGVGAGGDGIERAGAGERFGGGKDRGPHA